MFGLGFLHVGRQPRCLLKYGYTKVKENNFLLKINI